MVGVMGGQFHVEKQRKDVKPDDAPPVDVPGKVGT